MKAEPMETEPNQATRPQPKTWKLTPGPLAYQITPIFENLVFSTLDDISLELPSGAYTTFRTYQHTRALRLEDHLTRLNESAQQALTPIRINPDAVRLALHQVLSQLEARDYRFRLTLDLEKEKGSLYVSAEPLQVPSEEDYQRGVKVISRVMQRENPRAKLTGFIKNAVQIRTVLTDGVNEVLMLRGDGLILEGLSSNFFGVINNSLYTSGQGVLAGITRAILFDICRDASIQIHTEGIYLSNIYELDEAFITSASRAVLPVSQIDRVRMGTGQPGLITKELMALFKERIELETQEI